VLHGNSRTQGFQGKLPRQQIVVDNTYFSGLSQTSQSLPQEYRNTAIPALYLRPIEAGDINWPLQGANCQQ